MRSLSTDSSLFAGLSARIQPRIKYLATRPVLERESEYKESKVSEKSGSSIKFLHSEES